MKKSVGLVVITKIPKNGKEVLVTVLQRRNYFSLERMAPRLYPGCCQVTCHGKVEKDETSEDGILREMDEELGRRFTVLYTNHGLNFSKILAEVNEPENKVMTFGVFLPIDFIREIRLGPDTGGLVYVTEEEINDDRLIFELGEGEPGSCQHRVKFFGPEDPYTIAMFPDEIEAVRKAFEVFGKM